ncbi:MAG: PAS domain S-box protein [Pseudomonadota bacterium]
MTSHVSDQRLFADQVRHLYTNQKAGLLANLLNSLIVGVVFWKHVEVGYLVSWIIMVCCLTLGRYFFSVFYFRSQAEEKVKSGKWALLYIGGLVISGLLWGGAGVLFFIPDSTPHQIFLAFVLGGMVAGAAASTSALKHVFLLYIAVTLFPITGNFFLVDNEIHRAMGVMLLVYILGCIFLSRGVHRMIVDSLRVAYENEEEVRVRRKAEDELRSHQNRLESIVGRRTEELTMKNRALEEEVVERLNVEKQLRISEKKFRTLFDSTHDAIMIYDMQGALIEVNKVACERLGYTRQELLSMAPGEFVAPHYAGLITERMEKLREVDEAIFETAHLARNGEVVPVELSIKKIDYDGKQALLGVARDISERKKREAEALRTQKLESLGVLAGGIAHDFNNLLTVILGNISLARLSSPPDSVIFKSLGDTEKAALRAKSLTQQLLTFSKGGAPVKETAAIHDIIQDSADFALRGSKSVCHYHLSETLWCINADRGQLGQVFQNLVINASQAMPEGGGIHISASNVELQNEEIPPLVGGRYLRISVRDEGPGIPVKDFEKIFDPYFSTKQSGSGLGLAVVYSVIRNHDGLIALHSPTGKGATFEIYLPAVMAEGCARSFPGETIGKGKGRVLVMDDDKMIQEVAEHILRSLGFDVEKADDGETAIALYVQARDEGRPFDVVIMDLTIPGGMGGERAIEKLREIDPRVKAIVSSGYATNSVMANYDRFGFKGVAPKPFTVQELSKVVMNVLAE